MLRFYPYIYYQIITMKKMISHLIVVLLCSFCIQSCDQNRIQKTAIKEATKAAPVYHKSHEPQKQNLPFSDVVQVGTMYFLSGQIGMNHKTRQLIDGGIAAETNQTLENINAVLVYHNLTMKDVVKTTVILDSMEDFQVFNAIYESYFPQKPARTTFAAKALARGAKIEIEVVAVKKS